jgi:ABC-type molybdate transport system permease subunit
VLPALAPAFVASGAIAFATAMGAFGTAFTLATNIDVLPMLIYTEFTLAANFSISAALSGGFKLANVELGLPLSISLPPNLKIRPGELVDLTLLPATD